MAAICPHCNQMVSTVKVELVDAVEPMGTSWKSALFSCPSCSKVLNVNFDVTSHTRKIIDEVTRNITGR